MYAVEVDFYQRPDGKTYHAIMIGKTDCRRALCIKRWGKRGVVGQFKIEDQNVHRKEVWRSKVHDERTKKGYFVITDESAAKSEIAQALSQIELDASGHLDPPDTAFLEGEGMKKMLKAVNEFDFFDGMGNSDDGAEDLPLADPDPEPKLERGVEWGSW